MHKAGANTNKESDLTLIINPYYIIVCREIKNKTTSIKYLTGFCCQNKRQEISCNGSANSPFSMCFPKQLNAEKHPKFYKRLSQNCHHTRKKHVSPTKYQNHPLSRTMFIRNTDERSTSRNSALRSKARSIVSRGAHYVIASFCVYYAMHDMNR